MIVNSQEKEAKGPNGYSTDGALDSLKRQAHTALRGNTQVRQPSKMY